jgi:hypothetical protein
LQRKPIWIVASVCLIGLAVVSLMPVMMVPMLFDAPGSETSRLTIAMALLVAAFPVCCLIGAALPWLFRHRKRAGWLFLLPVADVAALIAVIVAMQYACRGQLAC